MDKSFGSEKESNSKIISRIFLYVMCLRIRKGELSNGRMRSDCNKSRLLRFLHTRSSMLQIEDQLNLKKILSSKK